MPDGRNAIHHQVHPDGTRTPTEPVPYLQNIVVGNTLIDEAGELEEYRLGVCECLELLDKQVPPIHYGAGALIYNLVEAVTELKEELGEMEDEAKTNPYTAPANFPQPKHLDELQDEELRPALLMAWRCIKHEKRAWFQERKAAREAGREAEALGARVAELEEQLELEAHNNASLQAAFDVTHARARELEAARAYGYRSAFNGGPGRIEESWARMHPEAAAEYERRKATQQPDAITLAIAAMEPYPEITLTSAEEHEQAVHRG